jgi:hypothetical protein
MRRSILFHPTASGSVNAPLRAGMARAELRIMESWLSWLFERLKPQCSDISRRPRLLIIEEEPRLRAALIELFSQRGLIAIVALDGFTPQRSSASPSGVA